MNETTPTLLIVDDERLNLNSLVELFQEDHNVLVAKDGPQALHRATGHPVPDLILLDILMPDMDGFETCMHLKKNPETAAIPIIFITALHEEEDQVRGFELGAVDFITKPFMPSVVQARVRTHLALQSARTRLQIQNNALQEAALLKEDVDRIMRHDLKGPLNGIIGMPQVLLEELELAPEYREMLRMVEQSGYKMLGMINHSLDLYKMETGTYRLKPESVDLARIVRKLRKDAQNIIQGKGLRIDVALDGRPDDGAMAFRVLGEEMLCYSMLSNLFQNALEAAPQGSAVTIDMRSGYGGRFRIHHRGAVPASIRGRFFDKYVTAGKSGGTGLGTYSARLMARTMGGEIHLQAEDESATAVEVSFAP